MATMRAKMKVLNVTTFDTAGVVTQQRVNFTAVCKKDGYDSTGDDENNSYAKWTPSADANFTIMNPALFDQFKVGDEFYVDFTKAE